MKTLLKNRGLNSNAVESVMKPVLEDEEEPGEESSSKEEGRQSSTGYTPHDETTSESFQLAKKETEYIKYSKYLVIVVIFTLAITISLLTFFFVLHQERDDYESSFHDLADELKEFSQNKAHSVVHNTARLCAHVTSTAHTSGQQWPFVTIDDFQVKGMLLNADTGAHTVQINPLVFPEDLEKWEKYSVENQDWMKQAHYYDAHVDQGLYVVEHYDTEEEHDPNLRWNVTGITPYVWTTEETTKWDPELERIPVGEQVLYVPSWQRAPACDFAPQVNMDIRSDPVLARMIDGMLAVDHAVITEVVDATYLSSNYEYRFDPSELEEPHSYVLQPIHNNLYANATVVGVMAAFMRWGAFFDNVLPAHERGIYVVLESTCGEIFTYELLGEKAVYIGEGDHRKDHLDLELTYQVSEATQMEDAGDQEGHHFCHYYAHIHPAQEWKDKFYTNRPYTFAAFVLTCFAITTIVFAMYDWLVQRRQNLVMQSAKRTDAIVKSLFPANVRDRLLEGIEKDDKGEVDDKKPRPSWGNPSMAFVQGEGKNSPGLNDHNNPMSSEAIFGSKPIADLFPETTIMFADMVGFTAWSSVRDPQQVFSLLETVYHSFDKIAKRRRVFKVETVGDCYVAVSGLPMPRKEHAVVMCKFATDCLHRMKGLVQSLERSLGPDTADLDIRIGLHSGPVTAGVLRGEKGRFQLFGDTMNTASRLESTGWAGRIHVSRDTAELLVAAGKEKWVTLRDDQVFAKGKGTLQTYWMRIINESCGTGNGSHLAATSDQKMTPTDSESEQQKVCKKELTLGPKVCESSPKDGGAPQSFFSRLPIKQQRLVSWNADILVKVLRQIVARRGAPGRVKDMAKCKKSSTAKGTVLDEVMDVLALPQFDIKTFEKQVDPDKINISEEVVFQMNEVLARIALLYQENPFHNFEHASHVTMSVSKLLGRIVNPIELSSREGATDQLAADLHDHTFGITSDPLTQFACIIAALIHDADHPGVPNSTLVKEDHPLASKYNNKSVAEQNSVDLAWDIITSDEYQELQACIYSTKDEFLRFRSIIVNVVMATDIMDKDLGAQRKARWETAFSEVGNEKDSAVAINRKATIVLEHLMQASDVAHTMQHWAVFKKWNERLFNEMYSAYCEGRSEKDPSESWFHGELGFFDYYIIPLAKKLEACGVFGVSSHEYLNYAKANRREWEAQGHQLVKEYLERFHNSSIKDAMRGKRTERAQVKLQENKVPSPAPPAADTAPAKMEMAPVKVESAPGKDGKAPIGVKTTTTKIRTAPRKVEEVPLEAETAPTKVETAPAPLKEETCSALFEAGPKASLGDAPKYDEHVWV